MLRWVLQRAITAFERQWNYDASYLREVVEASPRAGWLVWRAASLGQFHRDVPLAAWSAAAITAVRLEDCGPCTQLAVDMAARQGVAPRVLRAILREDVGAMPEEVALAWRFTRASLAHDPESDQYRQAIVQRWGPRAVVSLAFAAVAARMYPTLKYAMGHGKSCTRVVVDGTSVAIDHEGSPRLELAHDRALAGRS